MHLSDFFKRNSLSYRECNRRFCLKREEGTRLKAYNIDISGSNEQYFKSLYRIPGLQNRKSADGIYEGSFHYSGRQIYFVLVVELEGNTDFEEAAEQVRSTLRHFSKDFHDDTLADDGKRHHQQAISNPRPYIARAGHLVAGVVIGSQGRLGDITYYLGYPIICLGSRQPVQEITPQSLFKEIAKYTGKLS